MRILLLILFIMILSIASKSWTQEELLIPNGTWYGNFIVSGSPHCYGIIEKIIIINNIVRIKGRDNLGLINYKFTFGKNKGGLFKLNHVYPNYEFNYNRVDNTVTLSFNNDGECKGKETFKQK